MHLRLYPVSLADIQDTGQDNDHFLTVVHALL